MTDDASEYPARLYAAVHDGNPGDVEFYRQACAGAERVIELGCGDARVLAALVEEGRVCVGVDLDPEMLALARTRAPQLELICADMCALDELPALAGRRFERVLLPHGGLFCPLDPTQLRRMLAGAAELLAPGGQLILDAWAADGFHAEAEPADLGEGWLERVKQIEVDGELWEVLERSGWDKPYQRIDATYIHVQVGEAEAVEGTVRQRYVLADELRAELDAVGLELVSLAGDFEGADYEFESPLMVAIARRSSAAC